MSVDYKGRPRADVWEIFTAAEAPQRQAASECRHCGVLVAHAKKSERAKAHLARRCPPFRALMQAVGDAALRPEWFNELSVRRKRAASLDAAGAAVTSAKATAAVARSAKKKPKLAAPPHQALAEQLAMHFYTTDTPFAAVEDAFLLRAFRSCAPRVELPDRQALSGALLDKCYEKLRALVAKEEGEGAEPEVNPAGSSSNSAVGAVLQACVVMIEEVFAPKPKSVTATATTTAAASSPASTNPFQHLVEFVRECSAVLAHFTEDPHLKSRLEREQQVRRLKPLAQFTPTVSRPGLVSWHWAELKPYLDRIKASGDIIYAIVTGNEFLNGRTNAEASGQRLQLRQRIHRSITNSSFFEDLEKSIQILGPIHETMEIARATQPVPGPSSPSLSSTTTPPSPPPISDAYNTLCTTMQKTYDKMDCLSGVESSFLRALTSTTRLAVVSGGDAGVAHLLDPRYLGAGMSGDERDCAEDFLFDFFHRTAAAEAGEGGNTVSLSTEELEQKKEALFQEYTTFAIKSNSAKSQGSFRYQMLVKGTKTIQQYWATDGTQYPLLQQVAFSVFTPPEGDDDSSSNSEENSATRSHPPDSENNAAHITTPSKSSAHSSVASAGTPTPASPLATASPTENPQREDAQALDSVQREKLAFVKKHAALLLRDDIASSTPPPQGTKVANIALRQRNDVDNPVSTDSSGRDNETEGEDVEVAATSRV